MTDRDNGGPAFPTVAGQTVYSNGMTMRDWFAGQALAGPNLGQRHPNGGSASSNTAQAIAKDAYAIADAMLEARK